MSSSLPPGAAPFSARFSIAERATLAVAVRGSRELEQVTRSLEPYAPAHTDAEHPDVLVEMLETPLSDEVVEQLGDAGDGWQTGWDGRGLRVMHGSASCRLIFDGPEAGAHVQLEPGFPWWRAWSEIVRPLISIPIAGRDAAVVHASAVVAGATGIVLAGWAEAGKTEIALGLCEQGGAFISDKWTVLAADGSMHAMPVAAGLRAWTVPQLPRLKAELTRGQRARSAAGRARSGGIDRLGPRESGPAAAAAMSAARRAASLAGRLSLSPSALRSGNGAPRLRADLSVIVVLRAAPGPPEVRELDHGRACDRIVETTAYERRGLAQLDARSRYSGVGGIPGCGTLRTLESEIVGRVLSDCRVLELVAPFPADPRPAANALLAHLGKG